MSDPYIDAQSGILTNKFGLTDQESLDRAESNSVSVRSILLQLNPLKGDFDFSIPNISRRFIRIFFATFTSGPGNSARSR